MWQGIEVKVSSLLKVAATATFAFAPPSSAQTEDEVCKVLGDLGAVTMTARQKGAPLSDILKLFNNSSDEYITELARKFAITAYELPRYLTEENQQQAISEFRDVIELACYKKAQSE
jgi:hypothetical protein